MSKKVNVYTCILFVGILLLLLLFGIFYVQMIDKALSYQQNMIGVLSQIDEKYVENYIYAMFETVNQNQVDSGMAILKNYGYTDNGIHYIGKNMGLLENRYIGMGISIFIVGHVTKEGVVAGPRVLEHMVDTVLYFEGDRHQSYRILRAVKNRFGSVNELGLFEMHERGMVPVENPSEMLLSERAKNVPGSCVIPAIEGSRPMLVDVQALALQPVTHINSESSAKAATVHIHMQQSTLLLFLLTLSQLCSQSFPETLNLFRVQLSQSVLFTAVQKKTLLLTM